MSYKSRAPMGVMPANYFPHDAIWINEKLSLCSPVERVKVCAAYSIAYTEALDTEPREIRKENAGRRAANERLRIYIDKKVAIFNR